MTRQEEIEQAALNYAHRHDDDFVYGESEAFIAGAKWADRTMIRRACKWLKSHMYDDSEYGRLMVAQFKIDMEQ